MFLYWCIYTSTLKGASNGFQKLCSLRGAFLPPLSGTSIYHPKIWWIKWIMLDLDPTSPPHQHQAKRGQMTREWHATYYMVRDVHLPPLSLRGVYSPPLNTIPNSTRHAVTRKWHAGHQLFHYIYPGKSSSPWFGGFCTSKTVVWLIYAKKIKGRQMVFMAKGRQIGTRKKQLVYI